VSDRKRKTPAQRAQEALDLEQRRVEKLSGLTERAKSEYERLNAECKAAVVRRNYLLEHPDLPAQQTEQHTTTSTGADA
jgi:hypothetical protein